MGFPTDAQFDYLELAGERGFDGEPMLTNRGGVEQLQSAVDSGDAMLVGSSVVGSECDPEVASLLSAYPEQFHGVLIAGQHAKVSSKLYLRGCFYDDAEISGTGSYIGGHIQGYTHNNLKYDALMHQHDGQNILVNPNVRSVTVGGEILELSDLDFSIFKMLLNNRGALTYREKFAEELHVSGHALDVHIGTLRQKLSRAGISEFILTRRGLGFYIEDQAAGS